MEQRQLGTSTLSISALIMGTWQAGRQMWTDIDDAESVRAIRCHQGFCQRAEAGPGHGRL